MPASDFLIKYTIQIDHDGGLTSYVETCDNSFADIYRGFRLIKAEVERQIAERKNCPYNPKYGKEPTDVQRHPR
jgi:hypothetical protein